MSRLEHLLYALLEDNAARDILYNCGAKIEEIAKASGRLFPRKFWRKCRRKCKQMPELTSTFQSTIQYAILQAEGSGQKAVDGGNILPRFIKPSRSYAVYLLETARRFAARYFELHRARHLEN